MTCTAVVVTPPDNSGSTTTPTTPTDSSTTSSGSSDGSTNSTTPVSTPEPDMSESQLEVMQVFSTAAAATVAAGAFASASVFASSTQSMWCLLNQYQLIMMFPYLRTHLSDEFKYFLNGFEFAFFNFKFLGFLSSSYFEDTTHFLDYEQPDEVYKEYALESGSYAVNQFYLLQVLVGIAIMHVTVLLINKY